MPFDAAYIAPALPKLRARLDLAQVLAELRISPIGFQELSDHKRKMVAAHPPSWLYRHRHQLPAILLLTMGAGWVCTMCAAIWAPLSLIGLLVVSLCWFGLFYARVRGPARWRVRSIGVSDLKAPDQIVALARQVQGQLPWVSFELGELIQDRVLLDPYLVADDGRTAVVLGIWDGDKIIAMAKTGE